MKIGWSFIKPDRLKKTKIRSILVDALVISFCYELDKESGVMLAPVHFDSFDNCEWVQFDGNIIIIVVIPWNE